ncbi:hypothetical protein CLOP_g9693 [Closterium sp. NIES-67]|nr:hypothetical protein CLOP_g9693 [Closterium sp. NIES-67]
MRGRSDSSDSDSEERRGRRRGRKERNDSPDSTDGDSNGSDEDARKVGRGRGKARDARGVRGDGRKDERKGRGEAESPPEDDGERRGGGSGVGVAGIARGRGRHDSDDESEEERGGSRDDKGGGRDGQKGLEGEKPKEGEPGETKKSSGGPRGEREHKERAREDPSERERDGGRHGERERGRGREGEGRREREEDSGRDRRRERDRDRERERERERDSRRGRGRSGRHRRGDSESDGSDSSSERERDRGRGRGRGDRHGRREDGRRERGRGEWEGEERRGEGREGRGGPSRAAHAAADGATAATTTAAATASGAAGSGAKAPTAGPAAGPASGSAAAGAAGKELGRTGGAYIPPFKLARMLKEVSDRSSAEYQRLTWDALRKSINGLVNKVNASNIKNIIPELFAENLVRGRGLFCRACIKSQMASPTFTHVFAALVAVVNTKFPELGELLLKRIILQFRRAFRRNDKPVLLAACRFLAHLVNQQVAHEIVALELLTLLLETPTDDSVEVAVSFVKECGAVLQDLSPQGLHSIFERFRGILHEGEIDKRVQFTIEGLFAIRKAKFEGFPAVLPELDLVEEEDQITHELSLEEPYDAETALDVFKVDPDYLANEQRYKEIKAEILGDEEESEGEKGEGGGDEDDEEEEEEESSEEEDEEERAAQQEIQDQTETNLVNLRRTIYLTIMASVNFEEAGHKLMKVNLQPGQEGGQTEV